ncbi:MAG TPA: hypothetical protein RMG48_10690, partial [Myxococcales bacterium LLY-WYZ-16_1]|nr:hypothetical protein [Myxococcales bacterium LLY-WYZ-16_1]
MSIEIARLRALVLVVIIMLSSVACSERRSEAERPPALALGLVRTFEVDLRRFGATPSVQRRAEASSSHEGFELVSGTLEWKGRVEIVRIAEADNRVLEELAIVEQEGGVLTIGETRTSLPDWSQAPTLRYITDQRGHLEELVFEEEHDSLYQNLVQTILLDAVPAAPRTGTTVASEAVTDLLGRSRVTWRALEARDGSQSYRRTRDSNLIFSDDSIEKWAAAGQIQASGHIDYRIRAGLIEACNGTEEVKVVADDRTTYHYRLSLEVEEVSRRVDPERAQPDALA